MGHGYHHYPHHSYPYYGHGYGYGYGFCPSYYDPYWGHGCPYPYPSYGSYFGFGFGVGYAPTIYRTYYSSPVIYETAYVPAYYPVVGETIVQDVPVVEQQQIVEEVAGPDQDGFAAEGPGGLPAEPVIGGPPEELPPADAEPGQPPLTDHGAPGPSDQEAVATQPQQPTSAPAEKTPAEDAPPPAQPDLPARQPDQPLPEPGQDVAAPSAVDAYLAEGHDAFLRGAYDEARRLFVRAVLADTEDARPKFPYALAHFALGDYRVAAVAIRKGVKAWPEAVETGVINILLNYGVEGDLAAHLDKVAKHLDANPADADAWLVRGYVELFGGRREAAKQSLKKALDLNKQDPVTQRLHDIAMSK